MQYGSWSRMQTKCEVPGNNCEKLNSCEETALATKWEKRWETWTVCPEVHSWPPPLTPFASG